MHTQSVYLCIYLDLFFFFFFKKTRFDILWIHLFFALLFTNANVRCGQVRRLHPWRRESWGCTACASARTPRESTSSSTRKTYRKCPRKVAYLYPSPISVFFLFYTRLQVNMLRSNGASMTSEVIGENCCLEFQTDRERTRV